jgi:uncharacterized delta-60 repeat protein
MFTRNVRIADPVSAAASSVARAMLESLESRRMLSAGDLDTSFGTGGFRVESPVSDTIAATARQSDGKILVASAEANFKSLNQQYLALARYNPNGSLDTTFGGGDGILTDTSGTAGIPQAMTIQTDGKILVLGATPNGTRIARYTTAGALDPTFGKNGFADVNVAPGLRPQLLIANGKILALGSTEGPQADQDIFVARFNSNGTPDTTFSGDGFNTIDLGGLNTVIGAVPSADGSMLVIGNRSVSGSTGVAFARVTNGGALDQAYGIRVTPAVSGQFTTTQGNQVLVATVDKMYRFNADASLDSTFGTNGSTSTGANSPDDIDVRPDGKIVLTDHPVDPNSPTTRTLLVADVYSSKGIFESTASASISGNIGNLAITLIQPDNKMVVADNFDSGQGAASDAIVRFNANNSLDTTFSGDGKIIADATRNGRAPAVAIQADGKVLVAGGTYTGTAQPDLILRRYNSNGTSDSTFAGGAFVKNLGSDDTATAMFIQPDGKIVVSTMTRVLRLNSNGTLDTSFGGGDGIADFGAKAMARKEWKDPDCIRGRRSPAEHQRIARYHLRIQRYRPRRRRYPRSRPAKRWQTHRHRLHGVCR